MKTFLGMKAVHKKKLQYLAWLTSYFGQCVGSYEQLKSTDNDMKFDYIGRALSCLDMLRTEDKDIYDDIRWNYRHVLKEMTDIIKNH